MPATNADLFIKVASNTGWQLDASGISDASVTSFGLVSATSIPTDTAVILTVDRVDSSGNMTPSKMERIVGVMSGTTVTSCTRGLEGTAQAHSAGAVVEIVISKSNINKLMEGILVEHGQDGKHTFAGLTSKATPIDADSLPIVDSAASNVLKRLTWANLKANLNLNTIPLYAPQGFLINGKISVTDAAGITVAIKTLAGTDPSTTDPVYVRIGDTVRTISAALSVAKADGTNWCNAGSAELATKEIDYFVYLGYNATDGVVIGFSRIPSAAQYSDFSVTTTNEKYAAISTITTASATDYYEVVGRFAATLSAGAGYTWSVPTFTASNLIQRPIYETRLSVWVPQTTVSGGTVPTYTGSYLNYYQLVGNRLLFTGQWGNTSGGTAGAGTNPLFTTIPFSPTAPQLYGSGDIFETAGTSAIFAVKGNGTNSIYFSLYNFVNVTGQDQSSTARNINFNCVAFI